MINLIDKSRVLDSIVEIKRNLRRLQSLGDMSEDDFASDPDNFAIAEHHLRRSLETVLDIGRHVIAKQALM